MSDNAGFVTHQEPLPKYYHGWKRTPWAVVLHYTAGYTARSCYATLKERGLSVHYTVERNGERWQHVSDQNRAIHAGYGRWGGQANMNHHAYGIEMVNLGWMRRKFTGKSPYPVYDPAKKKVVEINPDPDGGIWYRDEKWGNKKYRLLTRTKCVQVPDHRKAWKGYWWVEYPHDQILSVVEIVAGWVLQHNILPENVIGHEHVSPHRKTDPGPQFPWQKFESLLDAQIAAQAPHLLDPGYKLRSRVRIVQSHCARLGLPVGEIDGLWGKHTQAAVEEALSLYGKTYGFEDISAQVQEVKTLGRALRLIPGFDPGRR